MRSVPRPTFELLLQLAEQALVPKIVNERHVQWCDENRIVGIARQSSGAYEIFLCGEKLQAASPLVARHLEFDQWLHAGKEPFFANRLVLPGETHYAAVAAFLAEELFRRGATESIVTAFAATEPVIEMALRRIVLSEEEILGLLGELRFLEVLIGAAGSDRAMRARAFESWYGYARGARDFLIGNYAVEIKTTRTNHSIHRISNVMQVDPKRSPADIPVEQLCLVSFGFRTESTDTSGKGLSLPYQVESVLRRLREPSPQEGRNELQEMLLSRIAGYGGGAGGGYDHDRMCDWAAYQTTWQHSFVRIYDMSDEALHVLRLSDLRRTFHVLPESVSFEVSFPDQVSGDINPRSDLFELATSMLR